MSRLIEANKFAELMKRFSENSSFKEDCRKAYNSVYLMLTVDKEKYSPTAYDVDKVVEQIGTRMYKDNVHHLTIGTIQNLVKRGGVENEDINN